MSTTTTLARARRPRRRQSPRGLDAACLALGLLASCASHTPGTLYTHPNADLSIYTRVAVLPLENLAVDRTAGDRVRDILVVELAAQGILDVVDIGEVNRVLRVKGVLDTTGLGAEAIQEIGKELAVQGLILGTVIEYRERRSGSITAPEVAISIRMLDVETGLPVWSVSDARTGASMSARLFGWGERSLSQASRELTRRMIATLTY